MDTCHKKAYAKINLGLDVVGRLPNGYHEVRMVMQTVGICDELTLERSGSGITVTVDMPTPEVDSGRREQLSELPTDEDNLVYKAAKLMMEEFHIDGGVSIRLRKRIPIAAGMAGGSTDAAAVLKGMNELFELGASEEKLMELGVRIGADVPYCVMGGTALAEGIGEKLTRLSPASQCVLVVAKPDCGVSTKYVYEHLDSQETYRHPDVDGILSAIEAGDLRGVAERLENVLETVTIEAHPEIADIKDRMLQNGALGSLMSGSGPTVFGIFDSAASASAAAEQIEREHLAKQIFITDFVDAEGNAVGV